jgi:hypothetical protein
MKPILASSISQLIPNLQRNILENFVCIGKLVYEWLL